MVPHALKVTVDAFDPFRIHCQGNPKTDVQVTCQAQQKLMINSLEMVILQNKQKTVLKVKIQYLQKYQEEANLTSEIFSTKVFYCHDTTIFIPVLNQLFGIDFFQETKDFQTS